MTEDQWTTLLDVIEGKRFDPLPVGFIIDSPWLPNWAGISIMDYYASESMWLEANLKVVRRFPQVMFLPGFWSEWGMCTEPSAFGAKCIWQENEFPFAAKVLAGLDGAGSLAKPDPRIDGLPPYVLKRLQHCRREIEAAGHAVRFAVARGPLNIAGFLAGIDDFLMAMRMTPDDAHTLLRTITDFLVEWIRLQAATFPTIDGVLVLDDIVGFCGKGDFEAFALPYLTETFQAIDATVRFFHNDAQGLVCAPFLSEIGVNLFNFSFEHPIARMRQAVGDRVALVGNIPTRDILAAGSPDDVRTSLRQLLDSIEDTSRIVLSCGGGMPPNVSTENIEAFLEAAGYGA